MRSELVRFQVLVFMLINMSAFWVMRLCRLVHRCQNFRELISISEQSKSDSVDFPKHGGSKLLQNISTYAAISIFISQRTGIFRSKVQFQIYSSELWVNILLLLLHHFPNEVWHRTLSGLKYVGRTQKGPGSTRFGQKIN